MILLYITRNVQSVITARIYQLSTHFELKVLGPLRYFLGLQVDYKFLWLLFINGNTFSNSWLNFTCLIQSLAPSSISSSSTLCISTTSPLSLILLNLVVWLVLFNMPHLLNLTLLLLSYCLNAFVVIKFQHFMPIRAHSQLKSNHHEINAISLYYILFICALFQLKNNYYEVNVISLYYIIFI